MNSAYLKIQNVDTLKQFLNHLQGIKNKTDLIVFFDWDDTLVNPDNDKIIEPEITKKLFKYMLDNRIFFAIITGRFHDTACHDNKRNLYAMQRNIEITMMPILKKLGVETGLYSTNLHKKKPYKVYNEKGRCVGVLFMGIFFTGEKGATIKNYLRQKNIQKSRVIFIDDYEPYLIETTASFPGVEAFRRIVPYASTI
ncbi:unnamed protein product [marine sediment metagenome]|uniref:Uncharacterized protein n=1 Tax=marine sediment metagenome TaxID=412755 RepID=X1CDR9_9ZZZZ